MQSRGQSHIDLEKISKTKTFEIQNGFSLNTKPKFSSKAQNDSIM